MNMYKSVPNITAVLVQAVFKSHDPMTGRRQSECLDLVPPRLQNTSFVQSRGTF